MKFRALTNQPAVRRVKRHWLTIAFLGGFLVDNLTLNNVEQVFDNVILASYVVLAMLALLWLYGSTTEKLPPKLRQYGLRLSPLAVQYAFGGLLSGMLIFYGRSGDWFVSWPFLIIIIAMIFLNESIHDRSRRLIYNLAILFIGLFTYTVLVIPVFTGFMGPWVFVGSGLLALFIMYWFVQLLYKIIPSFMGLQMRSLVFVLGTIFVAFNFMYFTNIIPPIPLSLKDVGIYHSVVRYGDEYELKYEDGAWWQPFKNSDDVFHAADGGSVFCYARVFAPTKLAVDIYHTWEFYDEKKGKWIKHAHIPYAIEGGNDRGYRGYTLITNYQSGKWRCSVETERGQVLGRERFTIDTSSKATKLVTRLE